MIFELLSDDRLVKSGRERRGSALWERLNKGRRKQRVWAKENSTRDVQTLESCGRSVGVTLATASQQLDTHRADVVKRSCVEWEKRRGSSDAERQRSEWLLPTPRLREHWCCMGGQSAANQERHSTQSWIPEDELVHFRSRSQSRQTWPCFLCRSLFSCGSMVRFVAQITHSGAYAVASSPSGTLHVALWIRLQKHGICCS